MFIKVKITIMDLFKKKKNLLVSFVFNMHSAADLLRFLSCCNVV